MKVDSQTNKIYRYLTKYKRGITAKDAYIKFGCLRLAARISDIQDRYKVTVQRDWLEITDDNGDTTRVKRYYLEA